MFSEFVAPIVNVDVVFSIILVAIQRMINMQFVCPCHSKNSRFLYDAFLSCSSLIIICLTVLIQMNQLRKNKQKEGWKEVCEAFSKYSCIAKFFHVFGICLSLLIPVLMWVIMWYFDGDLYVCVMSSWDGIWEQRSSFVPPYWCKPSGNEAFGERERQSAEWFLQSQVWMINLMWYFSENILYCTVNRLPCELMCMHLKLVEVHLTIIEHMILNLNDHL